jgi:transposase InsO family protein
MIDRLVQDAVALRMAQLVPGNVAPLDAMTDGRRFRILAIVDDLTRECLALVADTPLPGLRVARELGTVTAIRGRPAMIVSDNGTELTSMAMLRWSQEWQSDHYALRIRIGLHYSRVGRNALA